MKQLFSQSNLQAAGVSLQKLCFLLLCLLTGLQLFGQSKKKINEQLKKDLIIREREYDSTRVLYDSLSENWQQLVLADQSKVNEIRSLENSVKFEERDIILKQRQLDKLGERYDTINNSSYPDWSAVLNNYKNSVSYSPVFDFVEDMSLQESLKEQNEDLRVLISQFDGAYRSNLKTMDSIHFHMDQLQKFGQVLDSVKFLYIVKDLTLRKTDQKLKSRLKELERNYREKGGKGFSAAYAEVFAEENEIQENDSPFIKEDTRPQFKETVEAQFPGGQEELERYLETNLIVPGEIRNNKLSGKVFVQFSVSVSGQISDVRVHQVDKGFICVECEKEAVRLVKSMPDWIPSIHKGENVASTYILPITFE